MILVMELLLCSGVEGVPQQCPAQSHPGEGGLLGRGPGLDGCSQRGREATHGCKETSLLFRVRVLQVRVLEG